MQISLVTRKVFCRMITQVFLLLKWRYLIKSVEDGDFIAHYLTNFFTHSCQNQIERAYNELARELKEIYDLKLQEGYID